MPFASAEEYIKFASSVKHDRRFILTDTVNSFLDAVVETSLSRTEELQTGSLLWRAQLDHQMYKFNKGKPEEEEREAPCFEERMIPKSTIVGEGRLNPRGVAYLCLASNPTTAGSEMRPWLGAYSSVSQFRINRAVRIVDCTKAKKRWFKRLMLIKGFLPWKADEFESVVGGDIAEAMSRPYSHDEQSLNYVPTQIIAEKLRHSGIGGMVYRSLLSKDGYNFVLQSRSC